MRLLACAFLLASCATLPAEPAAVTGDWGGAHIGLHLTSAGGSIDYDCAAGAIAEPVVPHAGGTFVVQGTHTPGHGGPAIEGVVMPAYRATFTGTVHGDRMTLAGRVENGVVLGPFTLRRGAEPGIFRCL